MTNEAVDRIFARSEPQVRETARALIAQALALPDVSVDPKGTCIHLNRRTAFAGLHPRKTALLLSLRSSAPIESGRIRKVERASNQGLRATAPAMSRCTGSSGSVWPSVARLRFVDGQQRANVLNESFRSSDVLNPRPLAGPAPPM